MRALSVLQVIITLKRLEKEMRDPYDKEIIRSKIDLLLDEITN